MARIRGDNVKFWIDFPKYIELNGRIQDIRIVNNEVFYYIASGYDYNGTEVNVHRLISSAQLI